MFERRDVWELSEQDLWHEIIWWYARAVTAMQGRDGTDFSDPTSWRHLAAIHGIRIPRSSWPRAPLGESASTVAVFSPVAPDLPHCFESVVRRTIVQLSVAQVIGLSPVGTAATPRGLT